MEKKAMRKDTECTPDELDFLDVLRGFLDS